MRRETLIAAARRIRADLEDSGIAQMIIDSFEAQRTAKDEDASWISIATITKYAIMTNSYTEAEIHLCEILNIRELSDPQFWQILLRRSQHRSILEIRYQVRFALDHLPKIIELLKRNVVDEEHQNNNELTGQFAGYSLLSIIVPEDDKKYSTVQRIMYVLKSVNDMFEVYTELEGIKGEELLVLALDSGSDKSIDFVGIARAIQMIKELVFGIYDRRVFYKELKTSHAIALINESLPVIKRIEDLRGENVLSPEDAELLKRKMIGGVSNFLDSGALTAELDRSVAIAPRRIMRPEQKLLIAPSEQSASQQTSGGTKADVSGNAERLSPSEVEVLRALLAKTADVGAEPKPINTRKPRARKTV